MRRRWSCGACGARGTTAIETRVVFHECRPPRPRRRKVIAVGAETTEERRSQMFAALAGAVGPEALLRR